MSRLDYSLIFIVFLLFCASIMAIHSAPLAPNVQGGGFVKKQVMWYIIGSIIAALVVWFDHERFKMIHWYMYGFGILLLLGITAAQFHVPVPFVHPINGAYSWYTLPGIGALQPSEFMKIFLILSLSQVITKHNNADRIQSLSNDFRLIGKIALVSTPPLLLVLIQPDLGTALVMVSIVLAVLIVSGINWRLIVGLFLFVILFIAFLGFCWFYLPQVIHIVLRSHQIDRFYGWLAPYSYSNQEGFQLINSLNAIGSGELYGKGISANGLFIPEGWTDFIFSVIASEFGFIGGSILISLFFLLVYRIVHTAIGTQDQYGSYICTGIVGMFTFQIFENIGMTIQVMPITGITLPFISYGGSSLLTSLISIGLILSIQARTRQYMFD